MSRIKSAVAGALLGPWCFTVLGGTAFEGTYSPASAFFVFFILLAQPFWLLLPAGAALLIQVVVEKSVPWVSRRSGAILLSVGTSVLAWNAATIPLRFFLSMRRDPEAGGNPAQTVWIFVAATVTGLAWGFAAGMLAWDRRSAPRNGPLTTAITGILAVTGLALATALHAVAFFGPLYRVS